MEHGTLGQLLDSLATSPMGLSSAEARQRLSRWGPNDLAPVRRAGAARQLLALVASPLILVLLAASAVSAAVGDIVNAAVIAAMVAMGVGLSFAQTYRSQRAMTALRSLVESRATVLRDGVWGDIPRVDVVPGDVVRLAAGDLVPADGRLLEERDLHVTQAALTGESVPVEKRVLETEPPSVPATERPDLVFAGTSVVGGFATAVIVATGRATAFGDVAHRLAARAPETDFERGSRRFGLLIVRTVTLLVLFVLLVNVALHRDPLESFLFAVALAVGLTPEYLPVIMGVTLGAGALRMSRKGVIVKELAAIEELGSMDILCSDKTNTLTAGTLALERAIGIDEQPSTAALHLAALHSLHESGVASPFDAAILARERNDPALSTKVDEIPFDFERRRASVVIRERGGPPIIVTKGAPEAVIAASACVILEGAERPLDDALRARATATYDGLSRDGYRVLAVAARSVPVQASYGAPDEAGLTLIGLLAFADPPIAGIGDVVRALRADGIELKVLSGDNEHVARHVCAAIGIGSDLVVVGSEIDRLDPNELGVLAERTRVFARMTPAQKERVLLALKRRGHVVGFLGDGVNDAPSLHAADVGISVMNGVDVAKDAASVVLQERRLDVLHEGVIAGRQAFGNVMKYLLMGTSSSFGNMLSMAAATLFLPFLPMLPRQILVNDFLYDAAQVTIPTDNVDASFTRKPRGWDIATVERFMVVLGPVSSIYDFLTFGVLLVLFQASAPIFQTGWFVESLATQTLVLLVIRTAGHPLRSRPSLPLTVAIFTVVGLGLVLPFTPVGPLLGLVPLPLSFYAFLAGAVPTYLVLVEIVKRRLVPA